MSSEGLEVDRHRVLAQIFNLMRKSHLRAFRRIRTSHFWRLVSIR